MYACIDGLAQDSSSSIANALGLLQSCTNPLVFDYTKSNHSMRITAEVTVVFEFCFDVTAVSCKVIDMSNKIDAITLYMYKYIWRKKKKWFSGRLW